MRMYSEKFSKIAWFQIWTYDEVVTVEKGYAKVTHPNSIIALKTPRKGSFVEVPEVPEVLPDAENTEVETAETETIEVETAETETAEVETIEVETIEVETAEGETPSPMTFELDESPEEKSDDQSQAEPPTEETALTVEDVEVLVTRSGRPGRKKRKR